MGTFRILAAACLFFSFACDDSSINQTKDSHASAYSLSIDSCQKNHPLLKTSQNSMLSYSFSNDSIIIKAFFISNCCPEKNRFVTSTTLHNDSLKLMVRDTAQGLCDCPCNYEIQTIVKAFNYDTLHFACEYHGEPYLSEAIAIQ
jgi:hypothetical protein